MADTEQEDELDYTSTTEKQDVYAVKIRCVLLAVLLSMVLGVLWIHYYLMTVQWEQDQNALLRILTEYNNLNYPTQSVTPTVSNVTNTAPSLMLAM